MKKVIMTVEDRGIDYGPILDYLGSRGIDAIWKPYNGNSEDELFACVKDADGIIAGVEPWNKSLLERVKGKLQIIARYGVGYDSVDLKAAKDAGIVVTNTPGVLSEAVAELTLGLMLTVLRGITPLSNALKNGVWTSSTGNDLYGKTVGIVGLGSIGRRVVEILEPFSCKILAVNRSSIDAEFAKRHNVTQTDLDSLLRESDIVSLHLSSTPQSYGMVNKAFLDRMKSSAILINTGRGALVVEKDLVDALKNGKISGAALDVFSQEPLPENNILRSAPNLVITPHIASATQESFLKAGLCAAESIVECLSGKPVTFRLNR